MATTDTFSPPQESQSTPDAEEEWEYEYDETETEDYYFTLDVSTLAIRIPTPTAPSRNKSSPPSNSPQEPAIEDTDAQPLPEPSAPPPSRTLQVLDLHTTHPLIRVGTRLHSCHWTTDLTTQMYVCKAGSAAGPPHRRGHAVDVVGMSRLRLLAAPARLKQDADGAESQEGTSPDSGLEATQARAARLFRERLAAINRARQPAIESATGDATQGDAVQNAPEATTSGDPAADRERQAEGDGRVSPKAPRLFRERLAAINRARQPAIASATGDPTQGDAVRNAPEATTSGDPAADRKRRAEGDGRVFPKAPRLSWGRLAAINHDHQLAIDSATGDATQGDAVRNAPEATTSGDLAADREKQAEGDGRVFPHAQVEQAPDHEHAPSASHERMDVDPAATAAVPVLTAGEGAHENGHGRGANDMRPESAAADRTDRTDAR